MFCLNGSLLLEAFLGAARIATTGHAGSEHTKQCGRTKKASPDDFQRHRLVGGMVDAMQHLAKAAAAQLYRTP